MSTLYILYGSATGNAEGIALDLAEKQLPPHFSNVVCQPLETFKKLSSAWSKPPAQGKKHGLILISSTTGNGDAPENASRFVRYIKRRQTAESQPFQHCTFSVLGLGDTNYDQFCAVGKALDKRLPELGAVRAKPLACADEATGLEDVVEPYMETVLQEMEKACISGGDVTMETSGEKKKKETTTTLPAVPQTSHQGSIAEEKKEDTTASTQLVAPTPVIEPPPEHSDSPLFILYGSATGNAEHIAKELADTYETILNNPDSKTYFPSVICCEADQFKKKCLATWETEPSAAGTKHGVILVASTTGNGDAPENCCRFMRFVKRKQTVESQPFRHVSFAALGLGDTNYDQFCQTGKTIDKKLVELGGTRAKPLACADEATGLEDVVEPWMSNILLEITTSCRGVGAVQTQATMKDSIQAQDDAGESKQAEEDFSPTTPTIDDAGLSEGLRAVRSLLNTTKPGMPIPKVDFAWLPSLRASRSSCELFTDEQEEQKQLEQEAKVDEQGSISSSGSQLYSMNHPFSSNIVAARYLTSTSVDGASKVCDQLGSKGLTTNQAAVDSRNILDTHFPLDGETSTAERNGKRVIEMTLSLPADFTLEYQPGDAVGLIVSNAPSAVEFVLSMLKKHHGLNRTQKVSIDSNHPITIEEAVKERMDLCCVIKNKRILFTLAQSATNEEEKNALHLLSSKKEEGVKMFEEYIVKQHRSAIDVIQAFPSLQSITLEALLGVLSPIAPRYYSIASSPLEKTDNSPSLNVAFSVVDYVTPSLIINGTEFGRRRIQGVATGYLETMCSPLLNRSNSTIEIPPVKIFPKPTAEFRMPADLSKPVVLVGPGTGIAPFMGFLSHRRVLLSSNEADRAGSTVVEGTWRGGYELEANDLQVGDNDSSGLQIGAEFRKQQKPGSIDVFFGCRHASHDWLYKEELQQLNATGIVSRVYTSFSRDSEKREYVQDIMKNNEECRTRLVDLIMKKDATVYICGDGNHMARDVQEAMATIVAPFLGDQQTSESGKKYIDDMKKSGKLILDIWS